MTSTEPITLSAQELRRIWISEMIDAAYSIAPPGHPALWQGLACVILREAPGLSDPSNLWWPRKILRVRLAVEAGRDPRETVVFALRDMKFANDNDGR